MAEQRTDEELVEAVQASPDGDRRAFETLVRQHRSHVMANCRYISGSQSDAEDLSQEVFVKAFFGLQRFEGRSSFKTWLQRIKVNHCLNFVKKRAGKSFVPVDDLEVSGAEEIQVAPQAHQELKRRSQQERIRAVLEEMNDTLRIPLVMRDMDKMSYQEIADELDIKLSAVKMRIKRAREAFQQRFEELEAEEPS